MSKILIFALAGVLAGCAHNEVLPPEPEIRIVEVKVPQPVPCPALNELGAEPEYPDTDAALKTAPDLTSRVALILKGRLLRAQRLTEYAAAKSGCLF